MTSIEMPKSTLTSYDPVRVAIPARPQITYLDVSVTIGEYLRDHPVHTVDPETGEARIEQPSLTNEWVARTFAEFGLETVEDFKDAVWETLNVDADERQQLLETEGILNAWSDRLIPAIEDADVDEIMPLQEETMAKVLEDEFPQLPAEERLDAYLKQENRYAFKPKSKADFLADMRAEAKRALQIVRLTEAVVAHENPEITEEALVLAASDLYGLNADSPELAAMLRDDEARDVLARQALENYALEWLVRNTAIVQV